ncbi:unnamed protein product [Cylindrotheca closterium]|uniref:Uncharacterized protein n=1 Tax=Cylindrotheca closterium TaxID=2856 RepID=A0AAD2JKS8_9STRA|nr:unnamed protein product [Cylindrotheca closterium]
MPRKNNNKNKNKKNRETDKFKDVTIVGPDYIQILHGSLTDPQQQQQQEIALILCGESHEDAIDVTRRGGKFSGKEGWIDQSRDSIFAPTKYANSNLRCRLLGAPKKGLPLQKAKEWAKNRVEESDDGYFVTLVLLWVPDEGGGGRVSKGKSYILELATQEEIGADQEKGSGEGDDESTEGEDELWINPNEETEESVSLLPSQVRDWVLGGHVAMQSFEWGDLDAQAFALNQRRLTDEEISTEELDTIIRQRQQKLKDADKIWTWDDWFAHLQSQGNENDDMDVHLILEASVPPWELDLHRPSPEEKDNIQMGPAADCIRKVDPDEDPDEEDDWDPSSDGIGSFLDHVYRRFMVEQLSTQANNMDRPETKWLHCVDVRDLGCEAASSTDSVHKKWKDLLHEEERAYLATPDQNKEKSFLELEPSSTKDYIKFVPEPRMNPETKFVENLRKKGKLQNLAALVEEEHDEDEKEKEHQEFSYPSIEGFLGQNSDFLYYSKHVKVCYSPFMVKCVQSLENWDNFFTTLFFGGSIPEALSLLKLEGNTEYMYVRSQVQDLGNGEYGYRPDGEEYISYPFFPSFFYLCAKGTSSPTTWISNLFNRVYDDASSPNSQIHALAIQNWWMGKIHRNLKDPKGSDDPDCGGEWFEAYLHAVHREIYNDIDRSDATALLKKNKMQSLSGNRKHDIGKIQIPNGKQGFEEMVESFSSKTKTGIDPRAEVLSKILIDIYTSCLLDIAVALKVAEIAQTSKQKKVVIVLYLGSAHTKEVSKFFVEGLFFKRKAFLGKMEYKEDEHHKLELPSSLWNPSELFSNK